MKLSTKLNASFLLLLFAPLSVAILWLSASYSEKIEEEIRARLTADRKVAQLMLQQALDEFRNLAAAAANHQGLALLVEHELSRQVDKQLDTIRKTDRLDAAHVLSVEEGRQQAYTDKALSADRAVAGFERHESELFLTAAAPLHSKDGLRIGVLRIRRTLEHAGLVEEIARETGAEVRLEREKQPPPSDDFTETVTLTDNQETLLAVLELRHVSQNDLPARRAALISVLAAGLGALLLAIALHQYLLRSVIRPIVSLTHAADAIGNGEYHARTPFSGSGEIGELAVHFNRMAEQIQGAWQQCSQLNTHLEETVELRTTELQESNRKLRKNVETLEATQEQLIAQERLAGIGELAAGIAHELKNPLNIITQFSQLLTTLFGSLETELAKETPDQKELDYIFTNIPEFAGNIQEHTRRATHTVNTLLEQSRGSGGMRRPIDLNQLVKEVVSLAYHGMRGQATSVEISLHERYVPTLDGKLLPVFPGDLSRALMNITVNACQEVSRKNRSAGADYVPGLWIFTEEDEHSVSIRIRDNGDGIAEENRVRIFQPFFSRKAPGEGTGLGLSIARDIIVNLHQGRLEVDSRPGEFTEFLIELPK